MLQKSLLPIMSNPILRFIEAGYYSCVRNKKKKKKLVKEQGKTGERDGSVVHLLSWCTDRPCVAAVDEVMNAFGVELTGH